ncbi:unnamed protein product [Didymodactylos carnosus]|uniref:Glycogen [starch] synthase n=1 Tax=Didymodactylos carnosus TaxID=1234261 RepID=A0A814CRJ1_9BILA|nr:unnamed protein product [Didymodactylos carnosus]CAF0944369.1 unnamed protein product [Didymodactylos carnosus]CAF3599399.1 unnamed protein product [Didymodactylos carnosus]CAF3720634.1 unnamed protein product [Didymodactylos carnosus]
MSLSRIKHAAKSLKTFQGIQFDQCLDDGEKAEQVGKWLLEVSWEVANKVGGIYTVIRSKVPITKKEYGNNYICIGPYNEAFVRTEVEIGESNIGAIRATVREMKRYGIHVVTGNWLIEGYPQVVLFDISSASHRLDSWKGDFFQYAHIGIPYHDREANDAILFGFCVFWFIGTFLEQLKYDEHRYVTAHFHEWLAGVGLVMTRLRGYDCALVFTTHATLLGRYLCAGSTDFYNKLSSAKAGDRQIYHRYCIERAAASCAHVFTTVSKITGIEAEHLLNKRPDILTPNGLSVKQFAALHEFQNLHAQNKEKLNAFLRGHFFGHYDFDLDKTLYFFIAGRYEFTNKGADMFIESLARLNHMLKAVGSDVTIVAFLIFPAPTNNFNVESLRGQSIAKMLRDTVQNVQGEIGKRLYEICLKGHIPNPDQVLKNEDLVELKKCIFASQRSSLPPICTHNVVDDNTDPILCALRRCQLFNNRSDRVKVIFHPEFLRSTSPLLPMDYEEFVRGCHLGVFPSYYEPWGYTPAECTVMGVPSITTNLSGFGCFMEEHVSESNSYGIYVVDRRYKSAEESCQQLTQYMFDFSQLSRRQRIILRNRTERLSELLDWNTLGIYYYKARQLALQRIHPEIDEQMMKISQVFHVSRASSAPSSPGASRSSTPAPTEEDYSEEDYPDEQKTPDIEAKREYHPPPPIEKIPRPQSAVRNPTNSPFKRVDDTDQHDDLNADDDINFPPDQDTRTLRDKAFVDPSYKNSGKSQVLPESTLDKLGSNLGLPTKGTFDKEQLLPLLGRKSSISTQDHFTAATHSTANKTTSGESSAFIETGGTGSSLFAPPLIDQQAAQSIGKESFQ